MVRLNLIAALLSLGGADALSEKFFPRETVNLMVDAFGISPLPTTPPLVPRGLPKELAKRASRTAIDFPAPGYYCGLVNSNINNLLTCAYAEANCVQYGTAVGCCASSDMQQCTDIATQCLNWEDECDSSCSSNPRVTRCAETTRPYCGTYFFGGGKRLFGCRASLGVSSQVIPMSEYFSSRYGPNYQTMASGLSSAPPTLSLSPGTASETMPSESRSLPSNPRQSDDAGGENDPDVPGGGKKKKLGGGAIGGIVAGSIVGVGAIAGFLFFFIRKKKATAVPQGPPPTAPLMHDQHASQYGPPPPMVGAGYYQPEQKPMGGGEAPPYSPGYPPHMHHPVPPPAPAEMGGTPLQAQSQPLLGQSAEYYNQNRGSYIQPGSPQTGSIGSPPPAGTSPPPQTVSPHQLSATHTGPVPENIYEMPGTGGR
ncbi:hypothetical protein AJ78_02703 [Emergomyces pasteurianus Ep9510]|uniref:Uncharacterized protein n=1 Tax=Emergomyces pasteurianus Ep9510 TaxID=1447872 RepID=A0A1J9QLV1_9EURO|nr:hypothetical protein AJ78_02703 [Emergomyces pasteurianus Ep9510]